ncbi:MAG: molybdopterin cofactor-binding domain-containing protein [Geminicoccaceae bacterium]
MGGIRFAPDGRITLVTGTLDYGQGHASAFAQVLATRLGLPFDRIDLLQGDSDELLYGGGTGGSRSLMASGEAVLEAADQVVEKGMKLASEHLEAAEADIVFEAGSFRVAGTDRRVTLAQLGIDAKGALDVELVTDTPPSTCPNGCHVAEVEVDPETGRITLVGYSAVDDFGTLVNPLLVEGQVHGGVVQAIGQALTGARRLRRLGPAPDRQLHGLRPAARRRSAGLQARLPHRAGDHQPPGCQGLRRGRHHRGPRRRGPRRARRAGALWHHASRHAADAGAGVERHPGGRLDSVIPAAGCAEIRAACGWSGYKGWRKSAAPLGEKSIWQSWRSSPIAEGSAFHALGLDDADDLVLRAELMRVGWPRSSRIGVSPRPRPAA